MNWFMIIRIKHESESEKYEYCWHRFFFLQRYAFLLKDARNFGKMFEDEGDKQNKQGYHDIGESDAYQLRLT